MIPPRTRCPGPGLYTRSTARWDMLSPGPKPTRPRNSLFSRSQCRLSRAAYDCMDGLVGQFKSNVVLLANGERVSERLRDQAHGNSFSQQVDRIAMTQRMERQVLGLVARECALTIFLHQVSRCFVAIDELFFHRRRVSPFIKLGSAKLTDAPFSFPPSCTDCAQLAEQEGTSLSSVHSPSTL